MDPEIISSPQAFPAAVVGGKPSETRISLICRALVVIAFLFVILRALPIMVLPLGNDQGAYLMIGRGLLQGKHLYRDLADTKPPGIFIVYAGIAKLFGRVMWSAAAADALLLLIISYLLFRFTEPYLGRMGAAVAIMVHASIRGEVRYYWIAQPETFQIACVLAGYLLVLPHRRWPRASCLLAGLFLGFGCWLKYNAIAFLPLLLFLPFLDESCLAQDPPRFSLRISWRNWAGRAGCLLAGLVAASGIVLAWIILSGAWLAMKEVQFGVVPRYAAMAFERRHHYFLTATQLTYYSLGEWTLGVTLVALIVGWWRRDWKRLLPIFLAALSSYAAVAMQLRFHDYYFQICYPFFAPLWGYLAVSAYEGARGLARDLRRRGWRLAAVLVWIVFAQAIFWPVPDEFARLTMRYEELREWQTNHANFYAHYPRQLPFEYLNTELQVVDFLKKNAGPNDGLYIWGTRGVIYYLSGFTPPTRFHANLGLMSPWCPYSWRAELMRDLRKTQPRFIIVARHDPLPIITYVNADSETFLKRFPELSNFIAQNYRSVADFEHLVVYRHQ
jgi:hypothetical protein